MSHEEEDFQAEGRTCSTVSQNGKEAHAASVGGSLGGLEEDVVWPDFSWYSELQCGLG